MNIQDFTQRQLALLPPWFGLDAPDLTAILQGSASINLFIYNLQLYLRQQMRLQTMTGDTLDIFAQDYFGEDLERHAYESDDVYRKRIKISLLRPGVTEQAMIQVLTNLTGRAPVIWVAANSGSYCDYSFCDHMYLGSNTNPYEVWIIAYRPTPPFEGGISYVDETTFCDHSFGAYIVESSITDQDILDAIAQTIAEGIVTHVTILD